MGETAEDFVGSTQITRKGQITLLKEAREKVLEEGDKLLVYVVDGEIVLRQAE
jgi:AbrB family looped-hinge helix DNA binding protein